MAVKGYEGGNFLGPTVLAGGVVGPGMPAYDSEVFGPVLCLVNVETLEEAIQFVNSCKYGNGAVRCGAALHTCFFYASSFLLCVRPLLHVFVVCAVAVVKLDCGHQLGVRACCVTDSTCSWYLVLVCWSCAYMEEGTDFCLVHPMYPAPS